MVTSSPAWQGKWQSRSQSSWSGTVLSICILHSTLQIESRATQVPSASQMVRERFGIRFAFMISSLSGLSLGRVESSACFWEWGQHLCPSTAPCVAQSWKVLLGYHQLTARSCPLSLSPIIYLSHHHLSTNPFSHLKTWMQRLNNVPPNQNHY